MTTVYAPPDVEAAVVAMLPEASTKVPNPRPASFTHVTRSGGDQGALVLTTCRLIVECFGSSDVDAYDRARDAWGRLWGAGVTFIGPGVWVTRAQLTDPVNFPDTDTGMSKYQFIASLTVALTPVEV